MAQIASEALAERLIDWKVDTVFGLPGDGINGVAGSIRNKVLSETAKAKMHDQFSEPGARG